MKVKILKAIELDGVVHEINSTPDFEADVVAQLIEQGVAEAVEAAPAPVKIASKKDTTVDWKKDIKEAAKNMVNEVSKSFATEMKGFKIELSGDQRLYKDVGQFASHVAKWSTKGFSSDGDFTKYDNLQKATGMSGAVDSDGGFLLPRDVSPQVFTKAFDDENLANLCTQVTIGNGNSLDIPYLVESSRSDGSRRGGIRFYHVGEGDAITASQAALGQVGLKLKKLACLMPVTSELLEDGRALGSIISQTVPLALKDKINEVIISGTGAGQGLGILNAPCLISVNREGTSSGTIDITDLATMFGKFHSLKGVICMNPTAQAALLEMAVGHNTVYMAPNGQAPFGSIFGKRVVMCEFLPTLGTAGDILLADFSQAAFASKGGVNAAESTHLYFNKDETAFRWTYRYDFQPLWDGSVTLANGAATVSPFVALTTA